MKVFLRDKSERVVSAWQKQFADCQDVDIAIGSPLDVRDAAYVSPANSFGFMDGGLDLIYTKFFGERVQEMVQHEIEDLYGGELLVGQALVVATGNKQTPWLVCAPTMRVPMILRESVNPYLATKAALRTGERNLGFGLHIESLAFPGMGTGVGRVPFDVCARQMRQAFDDVQAQPFPESIWEAQQKHSAMFGESRDLQMTEKEWQAFKANDERCRRLAGRASSG